ncbi:hypothetical protein GGI25_001291 [Coemansia spiralis]|uniref:Uncharacterized protein n=2 Tax=Coemansia TaxID=4863 RepID=A0A9W8L040_9FUNG|nr:hypothetical protein BX070DRAFT_131088 [Coemansia spiralis]KAJ1995062.1 hypothetical protein EDC05_001153 [Coemansia umbellata]KAJ2619236.1 hypothetical protein GGI26_006001 [Coemansia sp. RSA 1358]KAJ2679601.1 hypothetical protein GGI25_001291 [Coemansia spiralis]
MEQPALSSSTSQPAEMHMVSASAHLEESNSAIITEPEVSPFTISSSSSAQALKKQLPTAEMPPPPLPLSSPSPSSAALRPILSRKSLIMSSTPRVPSNLRMVVAPASVDAEHDGAEYEKDTKVSGIAGSSSSSDGSRASEYTVQLSSLQTTFSQGVQMPQSPMLRREWSEPMLTNFVKRPASSIKCLPYPHTLDSYIPKQRPRSLNTLSNASCRLSIITVDRDYKEYSYKKQADVSMRPSKLRGWMRRFSGKIVYSLGQLVASPSLILKGNHDITYGNMQMNMSRQNESASSKDNNRLPSRKEESGSSTKPQKHKYKGSASNMTLPQKSTATQKMTTLRAMNVVEMAAAAESVADLEIAETAASLLSARLSDNNSSSVLVMHRRRFSDATTAGLPSTTANSPGESNVNSPLTGPTRSGSTELTIKAADAACKETAPLEADPSNNNSLTSSVVVKDSVAAVAPSTVAVS